MRLKLMTTLSLLIILLPFLVTPSNAAGTLFVSVSADKQSYGPGEMITINGRVSDESQQGVAFADVSIQVNDPNGNPIHMSSKFSGANGTFTDQFTVSSASIDGGYTIFATASKPGYSDASSQTAYTVIPEFPIVNTIWLILLPILLATLLTRKRKLKN